MRRYTKLHKRKSGLIDRIQNIWTDPVFSNVIAAVIAALVLWLIARFYIKYKNRSLQGLNTKRVMSIAIIMISALPVAIFVIALQLNISMMDTFTSKMVVSRLVIYWLIVFLSLVIILVLIPNQLKKYDLFLSVPMSFDDDKEYKKFRSQCLELIKLMEEQCGFKNVYFAGRDIESMKQFTPGQNAALLDLQALKQSKRFMMYMPKKMSSSCTFEAGYALSLIHI